MQPAAEDLGDVRGLFLEQGLGVQGGSGPILDVSMGARRCELARLGLWLFFPKRAWPSLLFTLGLETSGDAGLPRVALEAVEKPRGVGFWRPTPAGFAAGFASGALALSVPLGSRCRLGIPFGIGPAHEFSEAPSLFEMAGLDALGVKLMPGRGEGLERTEAGAGLAFRRSPGGVSESRPGAGIADEATIKIPVRGGHGGGFRAGRGIRPDAVSGFGAGIRPRSGTALTGGLCLKVLFFHEGVLLEWEWVEVER